MALDHTDLADIRLANAFYLIGIVIVLYDHIITLPQELRAVWTRPKTPWIFVFHRYFSTGATLAFLCIHYVGTGPVSKPTIYVRQLLTSGIQLSVCTVFFIRTLALYGGDRRIKWFGGVSATVILALGAFSVFGSGSSAPIPEPGIRLTELSHHAAAMLSLPWAGLLVYDVSIFALTWKKTSQMISAGNGDGLSYKMPWRFRTTYSRLAETILQDGLLYFAAIVVVNALNITFLSVVPRRFLRGFWISCAGALSISLTSRMMLNTYQYGSHVTSTVRNGPPTSNFTAGPTIQFNHDSGVTSGDRSEGARTVNSVLDISAAKSRPREDTRFGGDGSNV